MNTPVPEQTITPSPADMPAIRVEDAYRLFFERTLDMLCIVGADGYFKELNSMWERVLGYTHAELWSARFIAFVHSGRPGRHARRDAKTSGSGC
jgi:PAS domain S-box-containing protein